MSGKKRPKGLIPLNREVITDLTWFRDVLPQAIGVRFIENGRWPDSAANLTIQTDATLSLGISFVYNQQAFSYQIRPPSGKIIPDIFFLEEIGVLSAIHHAATLPSPPRHLLIYCDNLDAVQSFNAMRATEPMHNAPLLATAEIVLCTGINFRVRHIAGKDNTRADLISRLMFDEYDRKFPNQRVRTFSPPRELLPAQWRECF